MALTYRTLFKNYYFLQNITQPLKWSVGKRYPIRILASGICYENTHVHRPLIDTKEITFLSKSIRQYSTQDGSPPKNKERNINSESDKDEGMLKKIKVMYRDYWYVLLPVHLATSSVWFGCFYYTVRSGVDVLALLQSWGVSESIIGPLRDSAAGYFAVALAMYKLATPLRYAVTVGGTTIAIKKLTAIGLIKPVPSKEQMKKIFHEKKGTLQDRFKESKHHYKEQMKEKGTQVVQEMKRYKSEMRNMKNKVQKT